MKAVFYLKFLMKYFPFVFDVVFEELHNMLVLEVCGITCTEGIEHSCTIHTCRALQSKSVCVTETSSLHMLMQSCKGFHFPHSTGLVRHDI